MSLARSQFLTARTFARNSYPGVPLARVAAEAAVERTLAEKLLLWGPIAVGAYVMLTTSFMIGAGMIILWPAIMYSIGEKKEA